eukprot:TRINITY_DN3996_c0_g1_i1.p1 TRINITY_DN3996_c0_g1~~TRINITY_DN3996_c0_g1_i1.p1  ORF type:complete len:329 (+),score=33.69 TRINITY_DN3996_c0_g1_i1:128-1114(+)
MFLIRCRPHKADGMEPFETYQGETDLIDRMLGKSKRITSAPDRSNKAESDLIDRVIVESKRISFAPTRVRPQGSGWDWTPRSNYGGVEVELLGGGAGFEPFETIEDDSGCEAGIALPLGILQDSLSIQDRWGPTLADGDTTVLAVCKITVKTPVPFVTYTIAVGMPGWDSYDDSVMGRFFVGDIQNRLFRGYLAPEMTLDAQDVSHPGNYSLSPIDSWDSLVGRFRASSQGQRLFEYVENLMKDAKTKYSIRRYTNAFSILLHCNVWAFFSHTAEQQYPILRLLGFTCYAQKDYARALHWMTQAHNIKQTDDVFKYIQKAEGFIAQAN